MRVIKNFEDEVFEEEINIFITNISLSITLLKRFLDISF